MALQGVSFIVEVEECFSPQVIAVLCLTPLGVTFAGVQQQPSPPIPPPHFGCGVAIRKCPSCLGDVYAWHKFQYWTAGGQPAPKVRCTIPYHVVLSNNNFDRAADPSGLLGFCLIWCSMRGIIWKELIPWWLFMGLLIQILNFTRYPGNIVGYKREHAWLRKYKPSMECTYSEILVQRCVRLWRSNVWYWWSMGTRWSNLKMHGHMEKYDSCVCSWCQWFLELLHTFASPRTKKWAIFLMPSN